MKPYNAIIASSLCILSIISSANAAISMDRTRVIFNGGDKTMSVNISNDNTQLPYLAQSWIEDAQQHKISTGPIIVTPPVMRLEPGEKSQLQLSTTGDINSLPQDKESLFYFNLREIPPRSEKPNVLQLALQTRVKLFYRPTALKALPNAVWQDKLILNKASGGYNIENPTPYYVIIIGMGNTESAAKESNFEPVMLSPKSTEFVKAPESSSPYLMYINDYGGRPVLHFVCQGSRCTVNNTK